MQQAYHDTGVLNEEMRQAGVWVFAGGLEPASTARVVRVRDGALERTDGPYLDSKEHIGGFWIIDVPDLDAAQAWADQRHGRLPGRRRGPPVPGLVRRPTPR